MTPPHLITHVIFIIFFGTAILSTIALYTRQSLLVAYMVLGAALGPWGFKLVNNSEIVKQSGEIGIIFLLFLLGLDLQPRNLFHSMRKMSVITFASSLIFFLLGYAICYFLGYNDRECFVVGLTAMFSSTIIGIKLLPTTILHHQHTGELVVSILLLQDIVAILSILALQILAEPGSFVHWGKLILAFPLLFLIASLFQRYVLAALFERFDRIHEYIFIVSIGWCLFMAEFSHSMGLSSEIGGFIAGIALASHPISAYIAESLKPLRDFFLVLFFFSVGAAFNFGYAANVALPACLIAGLFLVAKPLVFAGLLRRSGEVARVSLEVGIRLGQMSEFSLLLIFMTMETHYISTQTASMVEAAILITFMVSCYWTVMRYPTPLATTEQLRRD